MTFFNKIVRSYQRTIHSHTILFTPRIKCTPFRPLERLSHYWRAIHVRLLCAANKNIHICRTVCQYVYSRHAFHWDHGWIKTANNGWMELYCMTEWYIRERCIYTTQEQHRPYVRVYLSTIYICVNAAPMLCQMKTGYSSFFLYIQYTDCMER